MFEKDTLPPPTPESGSLASFQIGVYGRLFIADLCDPLVLVAFSGGGFSNGLLRGEKSSFWGEGQPKLPN